MARKRRDEAPDWHAIYADWSKGDQSNAAIGRRHGVSGAAIGQKAKTDGWTTTVGPGDKSTLSEPRDGEIMERPGKQPKQTKSQTPEQLRKRAKDLAQRMLAEVEDITTYEGEIADIIDMYEEDPYRKRAAMKAISVAERIKMTKELTSIIDAVDPKAKVKQTTPAEKPAGKKEQRQEEAEKVAAGRFAPRVGPRLVSNG